MPINWPEELKVRGVEERSRRVVVSSESRNLKAFHADLGYHRWDLRMRCFFYPRDLRAVRRFIFALQRDDGFVLYSDPDWQTDVANKTTNGARDAGDTQIALTSITDVEEGMFLNFDNHDKLYLIERIDGNTLTLNCPLAQDVPAGSGVILDEPAGLFELSPDQRESFDLIKGLRLELTDVNLRLQEAL